MYMYMHAYKCVYMFVYMYTLKNSPLVGAEYQTDYPLKI